MLALPIPAVAVVGVGLLAAAVEIARRRLDFSRLRRTVGVLTLVALFGVAVALGVLGRSWDRPTRLLDSLRTWGTANVGAAVSVLLNNLPAAALLSAHTTVHPIALLIGLNLGPNPFVTGSLSWILWLRAARSAGATPSVKQASLVGLVAAPLAIAAAVTVAH